MVAYGQPFFRKTTSESMYTAQFDKMARDKKVAWRYIKNILAWLRNFGFFETQVYCSYYRCWLL